MGLLSWGKNMLLVGVKGGVVYSFTTMDLWSSRLGVRKRSCCSIDSSINSSVLSCSYLNSLLTPKAPSRLFTTGKVMTLLSVILVSLMWISTVVGAVGMMRTGGRWEMHL